jgi:hypothetical protein
MKKTLLFIVALLLLFNAAINSQIPRPFILNNGIYSYFVGKSEPPSDWKSINFNDSNWGQADTSAIGYGWAKRRSHLLDSVIIEKTTSLYLRIKFEAKDSTKFKDLNFAADFDDAYIAYLNGEEIARKNIGKPGDLAYYNTLADRSHEECTYRYYESPVNGVYIDSSIVKKAIRKGKNVFAIQVLNDSINGSDLSFNLNVYNLINYPSRWDNNNIWNLPFVKYYRQVKLDSSKFPIVLLETDEYGLPLKELNWTSKQKQVTAHMNLIYPKDGISKTSDITDFSCRIKLERRGQSSRDFPKMCYNVETQSPDGISMDTAIMGMQSGSDWVLNSNFGDKTMIRNELTFYMGRRLGHYEPRTQYCEMFYNGEYQGLYLFTEKIKRGKNKVNVAKRDSLNPSEGGFIFKYDKDNYNNGGQLQMVYPKAHEITKSEQDYFTKFLNNYYSVLKSGRLFLNPDSGYKKYISTKSLVDYLIVNEVTKNCDSYLNSTYLHKDKDSDDGRIKFGPLWDYDIAYGGAIWQSGGITSGWQFGINTLLRVQQLFRDTALTHEFARRWKSLRTSFLADDTFLSIVDSLTKSIEASRLKNYEVWPIINKQYIWPVFTTYTYDEDVDVIKNFTSDRMKWIDDNIDKIYYAPLDIYAPKAGMTNLAVNVYPNPFVDNINITLDNEGGNYSISILNLDGKVLLTKVASNSGTGNTSIQINSGDLNNLKNGMYLLMISKNGILVNTSKIIKSY